jgi:hypoxanthine-guanine phosphoribosyltransferase
MSKILYDPFEIEECTVDVSEYFNSLYNFKNEHEVVFAPILTGVVPFFNDVCKGLLFDPYVEYIGINSYQGTEQKEFNLYKMFDPKVIKDKTVWLFDDIADSGETLLPYKIYQTAVLHYKMRSEHIPTYYVEETPDEAWIVYPWEREDSETIQDYKVQ